jgi:hypothetical protein
MNLFTSQTEDEKETLATAVERPTFRLGTEIISQRVRRRPEVRKERLALMTDRPAIADELGDVLSKRHQEKNVATQSHARGVSSLRAHPNASAARPRRRNLSSIRQ